MGFLIKLLVLAVGIGTAAKLHAFDALYPPMHKVALRNEISVEQADKALDLWYWLSIRNILDAAASLPAPFGVISQVLVILILVGLMISLLAAFVRAGFGLLRWIRELTL